MSATNSTSRRPFWKRQLLDPLLVQLTQGIAPDKIALTIAVGSGVAMFPIIGVTTVLCLLAGVVWKLNQPILQLVNHALFPMHVVAIYFCVRWGETLFGEQHAQLGGVHAMARHMNHLFWNAQGDFWHEFGLLFAHAIVVWAILVPVWILVMYFIARPMIRWLARWKSQSVC